MAPILQSLIGSSSLVTLLPMNIRRGVRETGKHKKNQRAREMS